MAKRNFIPLVPSGTINADASVAQLEQDVLAMDAKVGELAEDIGDTEQEINQLKSQIDELNSFDGIQGTINPTMESGVVTASSKALVYSDSPYWVRIPEGETFILPKGTVVTLKDPDTYRFTKCESGNTNWYAQDNNTSLTVNGEARYTFAVRRVDWKTTGIDTNQLVITYPKPQTRSNLYLSQKAISLKDVQTEIKTFWAAYNGLASSDSYHKISEFIEVADGDVISYRLQVGSTGRFLLCKYNSNHEFEDGVTATAGNTPITGTYTVSGNGFIRVQNAIAYDDGYIYFQHAISDKVMVEIEAINETLTKDVTGTSYMQTALARMTGELKAKSELGNIVTIGFSTDQHIRDDDDATNTLPVLRGLEVMSKLTQAYPFDFVCLGGDACEAGAYATTLTRILDECVTVQKPLHDAWCPVVPLTGNHDAFQNNANITGEMMFNAHFKRIANSGFLKGWDATHTNGYWDSEAHSIRFIFFDDSLRADYTSTQRANALTTMLSGTPEGYKIVIFSHHVLSDALEDSSWANPIALQSVLSEYASRIICCICGHSHLDISETSDGILYIATTLAMYGYDQAGNRGTLNTETETAFDVFIIDQSAKKIYALRYGNGENREWTYT